MKRTPFDGHIPEDPAWEIVAYVQSMSGQLRKDVAPSDGTSTNQPENARPRQKPRQEQPPQPKPPGAR